MWTGRGPFTDRPILKGSQAASEIARNKNQIHTLTSSQSTNFLGTRDDSARSKTLPRSATLPDVQYAAPQSLDDSSTISNSSATASSATATGAPLEDQGSGQSTGTALQSPRDPAASGLRSRSVPNLASTTPGALTSEYMTAIPTVRRAKLRPISEALAPQPSLTDKVLRSIPVVNWFYSSSPGVNGGEIIGSGPLVKDDGTFDEKGNGWYWRSWYWLDGWLGTDFCGLKGED